MGQSEKKTKSIIKSVPRKVTNKILSTLTWVIIFRETESLPEISGSPETFVNKL